MKFLTTNLCTENATVVTASSANPNFPVSNLKNPLRSKRWRSSGTFEIDSSNNKINFKESAMGSELTATLNSGSYSMSGLKTEIQTRMGLVGTKNYTAVYSTTSGLWTLSSDGTYFSLLNLTGTNNAVSFLKKSLGFPNLDKTGSLTYTGSLIACHTKESIVFDMRTIQDITSVIMLWPKEDGIKLSDSAILKIEANATNTFVSPALSETLFVDNNYLVASIFFPTAQNYRYWRMTIQDPQNPYLYVELGMAWIGENVDFQEPQNGFQFTLNDQSNVQSTDFGHQYVDEYPTMAALDFGYSFIEYETAQLLENAYRQNGIRKPVLVVFDDQELVFRKNHFLIYGKMEKSYASKHVIYNLLSGGIKITELG